MTEYVLQKKLLGRWDYVTWYGADELDKAQRSYDNMTKGNTGYSWRLVRLETLSEKILDGSREIERGEVVEEKLLNNPVPVCGPEHNNQLLNINECDAADKSDGWTSKASGWSNASKKSDHGLSGSVWVGNPITKEKKRVPAAEAAKMLNEGWVKAGPRTVL